jgi:hypothetical protein
LPFIDLVNTLATMSGIAVAVDSLFVLLFAAYLVTAARTRPSSLTA